MHRVVQCPACLKKIRIPENLKRRKIRCPAADCGTMIELTDDAAAPAAETFALTAAPAPPARPGPADMPSSTPARDGNERYLEIRIAKDKSEYMPLAELRQRLLSGALTRKHKARWIEPEPDAEQFQEEAQSFRNVKLEAARKRWQRRQQWRRIGESLAVEEPSIESLYRLRIRFDKRRAELSGAIVGMATAVGLVVWVVWFVVSNSSELSVPGGERPGLVESLLRGNLTGAWRAYESFVIAIFVLLVAFCFVVFTIVVLTQLAGRLTYHAVGWGCGLRLYLHQRANWERPPDDGYGR